MVYKNKKSAILISSIILIGYFIFIFQFNSIAYRVFGITGGVWIVFYYISAVFEYYKVDDTKITYRSRLKKHEVFWKDICRVYITDTGLFKEIRVDYGFLGENNILISSTIKEYKELIKTIICNTENNPDISIDIRLDDFLNS